MNEMRPWYFKPWGVILILIAGIILSMIFAIAFSVIRIKTGGQNSDQYKYLLPGSTLSEAELKKLPGSKNYWLGSDNPKITIVIFSDYGCPVCLSAFPKLREISKKYGQSVRIIHRDFPIVTSYSNDLAMAGRCAGEQGFFWLMYDKLFLNQGVTTKEGLVNLGQSIGLDKQKFSVCLDNKVYQRDIDQDIADGDELGVEGTPTWFINGFKIAGDVPLLTLIKIIEANN